MAELIAKRYSNALFEVALEMDNLDQTGEELSFITGSLEEHEDLFKALKSPLIKSDEKKEMLKAIFQEHVSKELMNFLSIIIDKHRGGELVEIGREYKKLAALHQNTIEAVATTAVEMSQEQMDALSKKLSETSGKTVTLQNLVDPTIIGGVFVKMGDKIIDGTMKRRLTEIEEQLKEIII